MVGLVIGSCVGLTLILKYGKPTKFIRDFADQKLPGLFGCALCLGFWAGLLHALILLIAAPALWVIFLPCASAITSWFADSVILAIQMIEICLKEKAKYFRKGS